MSFIKNIKSIIFLRTLKLDFLIVLAIIIGLSLIGINVNMQFREVVKNSYVQQAADGLSVISDQIRSIQESLKKRSETFSMMLAGDNKKASLNVVNLGKMRKQVVDVVDSNSLALDVILFFYDKDLVITSHQIFYSSEDFFSFYNIDMDKDIFYKYSSNISFITSSFYTCSYLESKTLSKQSTAFCFAVPLDINNYSSSKGMAFVFFDRHNVEKLILPDFAQQYGNMQLYDSNNQLLVRTKYDTTVNYPMEVSIVNSYGTLRANVQISDEYFSKEMKQITSIIISMCLITLAIGILFAFAVAYYQSQPALMLMKTLVDKGILKENGKSDYLLLPESIKKIIAKNEDIENRIAMYEESIQGNLIERLLNNQINTFEQEQELFAYFKNFPLPCMVFYGRVYVSSVDSDHALTIAKVIGIDYLRSLLPDDAIIHSTSTYTLALIYPCNVSCEEAEDALNKIVEQVNAHLSVKMKFVRGGLCEDLQSIPTMYSKAQLSFLNESLITGHQDRVLDAKAKCNEGIFSTLNINSLQYLSKFLIAGDEISAKQCVRTFFSDGDNSIEADAKQRYYTIRVILLLVRKEVSSNHKLIDVNLPSSFSAIESDMLMSYIYDACEKICNFVKDCKRDAEPELVESLRNFLENNYQDPNLCSAVISEKFSLSEKHLFNIFKENTGYSPISYLHHIRMIRSASLLANTDMTVQEISESVGFSNLRTFQKAFKREYGLAPSKYRNISNEVFS